MKATRVGNSTRVAGDSWRLFDASESHEGQSADELLDALLAPLAGNEPASDFVGLVAANDGRLLDFFERRRSDYVWVWDRLEPQVLGRGVQIGRHTSCRPQAKSSTRRDAIRICSNGFSIRWLRSICGPSVDGCVARAVCPIKFNASTVADENLSEQVRERLRWLLLAVHLRKERKTDAFGTFGPLWRS